MSQITEQLARPARTGTQGGAAEIMIQCFEAFGPTLSTNQHVALLGALTLVLGYVQVLVENKAGFALFRNLPAQETEVVATEDDKPVNTNPYAGEQPAATGPVEQTDNRPRPVDPDIEVSQDPAVTYGQEPA